MLRVLLVIALWAVVAAAGCRNAEPPASTETAETVETVETVAVAAPATEAMHDVTGAYFAMDPLPAEFADLDHLSLATIDANAAPAPLNGFLRPKKASDEDYVLVDPKLEAKTLTFTTRAVAGVHYTFSGAFAILENFPQNPPSYETAVLTGTLTKMRDGRAVATTPVKFRYEAGG